MQQPELARYYTLDVSVEEISTRRGYVYDLSLLKKTVEREIVDIVDHKNFNLDVPFRGSHSDFREHCHAFWTFRSR